MIDLAKIPNYSTMSLFLQHASAKDNVIEVPAKFSVDGKRLEFSYVDVEGLERSIYFALKVPHDITTAEAPTSGWHVKCTETGKENVR